MLLASFICRIEWEVCAAFVRVEALEAHCMQIEFGRMVVTSHLNNFTRVAEDFLAADYLKFSFTVNLIGLGRASHEQVVECQRPPKNIVGLQVTTAGEHATLFSIRRNKSSSNLDMQQLPSRQYC